MNSQSIARAIIVTGGLMICGPANAGARDDVVAGLARCSTIADDKARLACYDALAPRAKDAMATPPASLDHEPTKEEQESWFGFNFDNLFGGGVTEPTTPEQFGKERTAEAQAKREEAIKTEAIDSITDKVTEVAFTPFGRFVVFLKNGQVWRQIEGDTDRARFLPVTTDNVVTISRGSLGSYNLQINDSNQIYKVTRVK